MAVCTFFGHRDYPASVKPRLMAFSFDLGLAISAERYGAISAGPEQRPETVES